MASRRRSALGISRSVAASLAALLLLTGGLFIVSTLEEDHQEWVLVEDEVLDEVGIYIAANNVGTEDDSPVYVYSFDEDTATYTYDLTGGSKESSSQYPNYFFAPNDSFDYSKVYKFAVTSSDSSFSAFQYYTVGSSSIINEKLFDLKSVAAGDDGSYSASIILYDQYVTDLSFKSGFYIGVAESAASSTFEANTLTLQVYELQTDNAGSTAAGILGIVLIIMAVLATPAHNIFRRR